MKSKETLAAILIATAMLGSTAAPIRKKRYVKPPLSKKTKQGRRKNKSARQARKINRK